jgi:hypothetical protein
MGSPSFRGTHAGRNLVVGLAQRWKRCSTQNRAAHKGAASMENWVANGLRELQIPRRARDDNTKAGPSTTQVHSLRE